MGYTNWNRALNFCLNCGKEIELTKDLYWFSKKGFFNKQDIVYCKDCLINRLKMEGIESQGIKSG
jgi:hypothetical protein